MYSPDERPFLADTAATLSPMQRQFVVSQHVWAVAALQKRIQNLTAESFDLKKRNERLSEELTGQEYVTDMEKQRADKMKELQDRLIRERDERDKSLAWNIEDRKRLQERIETLEDELQQEVFYHREELKAKANDLVIKNSELSSELVESQHQFGLLNWQLQQEKERSAKQTNEIARLVTLLAVQLPNPKTFVPSPSSPPRPPPPIDTFEPVLEEQSSWEDCVWTKDLGDDVESISSEEEDGIQVMPSTSPDPFE